MPILTSDFCPPLWLKSGHAQTVAAHFRQAPFPTYRRERIPTPDDDFLDLDWAEKGADKLAIVCHGLEGNSSRPYVRGMVSALNQGGWDACAMNYRGCGGEINRRLRFYHSGATDDLATVIAHALAPDRYRQLALIGFSLGGNLLLKYLGEQGPHTPAPITHGVAFSVP
ncbi:MAG: alpha/beta hydrolase, partial [Desulfovibrio sp.]|nr:alpha/beta hydrolase [Desulfovibrio sp.]